MRLNRPTCVTLLAVVAACARGEAPGAAPLTEAHAAAMRDSVRAFLDAYAKDVSSPTIGRKAREAMAPYYAPSIVMSTDLAGDEPVLVQTIDSIIPAEEVVQQIPWIRATRLEWGTVIITPLAPGLAMFSAKYAERVTDTTGTETPLRGVQQGVVRHEATGWRLAAIQSAHPGSMHRAQEGLMARMMPSPGR